MSIESSTNFPPHSTEEIGLKEIQRDKRSSDSLSVVPPSDPPSAATIGISTKNSPPNYFLPNSPHEMFLKYDENEKRRMKELDEKNAEKQNRENESKNGKQTSVENSQDLVGALNRRQTRLYRTLVWTQFGITVFTCIFIMVIMVLVGFILVMLQQTINRADNAIRDNPVSQMYMKLKNAVNKIPG